MLFQKYATHRVSLDLYLTTVLVHAVFLGCENLLFEKHSYFANVSLMHRLESTSKPTLTELGNQLKICFSKLVKQKLSH